jgi:hypothetical protein
MGAHYVGIVDLIKQIPQELLILAAAKVESSTLFRPHSFDDPDTDEGDAQQAEFKRRPPFGPASVGIVNSERINFRSGHFGPKLYT